jgi:hypothetical protein
MWVRTAVGWSLLVALVVAGAAGLAAGQGDAGSACEGLLTNGTDGEPGEELAGAIGEQESAIDSELADRRFDARLRNASSDEERAEIIAAELDRLRTHADALAACAEALPAEDDATDEQRRERERALAARANATAARVNETAAEARTLPGDLRSEYGVEADAFDALLERVLALRESLDATASDSAGQGGSPEEGGSGGQGGNTGEGDGSGEDDGGARTGPFR